MIAKPFDSITKEDLEALVENEVAEGRQQEYKRDLPGSSDEAKREFLADVSSFANGGGGDLFFGIQAVDGIPKSIPGLPGLNADKEMLRLEACARDSIDPRVPGLHSRAIEIGDGVQVLLMRIPESWAGPHMVTYKGSSRFYTRSGAGKHQMDVRDIRAAFEHATGLGAKIRDFVNARLGKIIASEAPLPLPEGPVAVMHVVPLASIAGSCAVAASDMEANVHSLRPLRAPRYDFSYNAEGFVVHTQRKQGAGEVESYCQAFRNGIIETASTRPFHGGPEPPCFGPRVFENEVLQAAERYQGAIESWAVPYPVLHFVSILRARRVRLFLGPSFDTDSSHPVEREILQLPEVFVELPGSDLGTLFKPSFDALWNACGYPGSRSYDEQGNRRGGTEGY